MEDLHIVNALDIPYVKLLRLSMLPIGAWPDLKQACQTSVFKVQIIYIMIQLVVVIGEIFYLHDIIGVVDFFHTGDVYITTFLTCISLVRLCLPLFRKYYDILRVFFMEFHLTYFKHKGESFKKVFSIVDKISHYFTVLMINNVLSIILFFNLTPMYVNFKNGAFTTNRHDLTNLTLEFSVRFKFPGYDQSKNFLVVTILNFYLSLLCSLSIIVMDLLLILMIFQIIGHLEILAMNLKSMPKPKKLYMVQDSTHVGINVYQIEIFDKEENLMIHRRLKELVDHHNLIISFTDNISDFFGPMLGFTYMFHLVSCCLLLLECSQGGPDVIARYGPLTVLVFLQLIEISVIFEVVGHKSTVLINCVYELPWQCMNTDNQRIVYTMLRKVQKPIQVTAFGLVHVGVTTMASILRTTFSYYTFLRSL